MENIRFFCRSILSGFIKHLNSILMSLAGVVFLYLRYHIASQFFTAGLMKVDSWQTTVFLFQSEYEVPLLSPSIAALLGTSIELVCPVFLLLGLFGRLPALILFLFNFIAVVSYPYLLTEVGRVGLNDHYYWGLILAVLMTQGPGILTMENSGQWFYTMFKKAKHSLLKVNAS